MEYIRPAAVRRVLNCPIDINPFGAPFKALKRDIKFVWLVYESGTLDEDRNPYETVEHHIGYFEFSVRKVSLQAIEDFLCEEPRYSIPRVEFYEEKIRIYLGAEVQVSESFPFEDAYQVLDIYLVNEIDDLLDPEIISQLNGPINWKNYFGVRLDCFEEFHLDTFDTAEEITARNQVHVPHVHFAEDDEYIPIAVDDTYDTDNDVIIKIEVDSDTDTDTELDE
jgi:hypothetical protein